jgi:hypothetical protein
MIQVIRRPPPETLARSRASGGTLDTAGRMRLAAAGHAQVIRQTLRMTALAEIAIYRDVSLPVTAHLGGSWAGASRRPRASGPGHAGERLGG